MSYARITAVTIMIKNGAGKVPGLLAVLALVPDPRRPRGRRFPLVFVLAVAAACTLAGAKTFREIGDQAADLPQKVLRDLGGKPHPLRRKVIAPSETRIRTLLHLIDTEILDEITGGWLRDLADAGRMDGMLAVPISSGIRSVVLAATRKKTPGSVWKPAKPPTVCPVPGSTTTAVTWPFVAMVSSWRVRLPTCKPCRRVCPERTTAGPSSSAVIS